MDPTRLISAFSYAKISQYVAVAGATLYFYDYFLTLGSEVELFWKLKGGWLLKLVVISIRYFPLLGFPIGLISSTPLISSLPISVYVTAFISSKTTIEDFPFNSCRFSMVGAVVFVVFSGVSTSALFTMRVSTLYESRPKIRHFVITIFWVSTVAQVVISAIALSIFYQCIGTISGHCAMVSAPSRGQSYIIGAGYMSAVPCEVVILVATIYHAFHSRRLVVGTSVAWPILRRLYTDGAFWFATALSVRLFGCFQWFFFPDDLKSSSDPMLYALQSIVAVRFFLALRRQIGNSALSTSTVVHVAPSLKLTAGSVPKHSTAQSFPPLAATLSAVGVGRRADDQHPSTFGTGTGITSTYSPVSAHSRSHSHSRRDHSWMLPSFSTTTTPREACSRRSHSRPYSNNTFGGEDIQMASISTREYEHEATRSRLKRDESMVHSTDTSPYELEICRTNSEPKAITSTTVGAPP